MSLGLILKPVSKGEVFLSSESSQDTVPETLLPADHPFHALWKDHLAELADSPLYNLVIDAFVAICQGTPYWKTGLDSQTVAMIEQEMRDLLRSNPPDVIAVSGMIGAYGYHQRRHHLWSFISISFDYITLWAKSPAGSRKSASLTALLKTCLDHEIGHWLFTLKAGWFSEEYYSASNIKDPAVARATICTLGRTSKDFQTTWEEHKQEAGRYVEFHSRGGIIGYCTEAKCAFMRTGPGEDDLHFLPMSYLSLYTDSAPTSSLLFTPKKAPTASSLPRSFKKEEIIFFPFESDECSRTPGAKPIDLTEPMSECQRRTRGLKILEEILHERAEADALGSDHEPNGQEST